jgi:predicted ATP-grasp superfamily ATP-dependent carboligase
MKKVLLLEPSIQQSFSLAKYLKKYSREYYVVGGLMKGDIKSPKNHYCDDFFNINDEMTDIFDKFDIIVPTGAKSTKLVLSKVKKIRIGEIPFSEDNLIVSDKVKILQIVKNLDIPIPKTIVNEDTIDIEYPIFYKEAFESGGGRRGVINCKSELQEMCQHKDLLFQEYIESPYTFGVCFLAIDGEIISYFIHKEILSYPKSGGNGVILETYTDTRLYAYTERILKNIKYNGWGMAEYKYCNKREDFVFMEINAKFWASIEFALINNNQFMRSLFSIDYNDRLENQVIYINRLLNYPIMEFVIYMKRYYLAHWIYDRSLIIRFVYKFIPTDLRCYALEKLKVR